MTSVLVVERDPSVCAFVVEALETDLAASVTSFTTAALGFEAINTGRFNLAIIDVGLSVMSGLELGKLAANRNIPPLLSSGNPETLLKLQEFDLPHLAKPFRLDALILASAQAIAHAEATLTRVRNSFARMEASNIALRSEIGETRRALERTKAILDPK